jgi:hypothetical protein
MAAGEPMLPLQDFHREKHLASGASRRVRSVCRQGSVTIFLRLSFLRWTGGASSTFTREAEKCVSTCPSLVG